MIVIAKKILPVFLIVLLGTAARIFFVQFVKIPNFEMVSSFALLSGFYLGGIFSFLTPLLIIFLSDLFVGNTAILLFTWSAFGVIGLLGILMKKMYGVRPSRNRGLKFFGGLTPYCFIFGILASCFFFLYTNFGWWVLSNMYPHTLQGLITCYVNGLPFFKTNLMGNIIFTPLVFGAFFAIKKILITPRITNLLRIYE